MIDFQRRTFVTSACAALVATPSLLRAAPAAGELRDDIVILRRALDLHPGLLRYRKRAQIDHDLRLLEREYSGTSSQTCQFLLLAEFLAKVRCGHTQCNPYNQGDAVVSSLFERRTRVPFEFAWIDGHMVVLADRSGSGWLEPGTAITAINGESTRDLLHRLVTYARADGHNDGKRIAQMDPLRLAVNRQRREARPEWRHLQWLGQNPDSPLPAQEMPGSEPKLSVDNAPRFRTSTLCDRSPESGHQFDTGGRAVHLRTRGSRAIALECSPIRKVWESACMVPESS